MIKEITVCVPRYVWKFLQAEPDYISTRNTLQVPRRSELGRLIHSVSRTIPYTQRPEVRTAVKGWVLIEISYNCKKKSYEVPSNKIDEIELYLIELFRSSLVREVAAVHYVHPDDNYSWIIRTFLDRRQIVVAEEKDKDVDFDTVKKIYRDHLSRVQEKNRKNRQLFQPLLSPL